MISPSPKSTYVLVFLFAIFLQFSCSKDSDLLADYVIQDSQVALLDIKVFANTNKPVIIAPLNEGANAIITEVSEPSDGTAEVNPDNTITYTPEPNTTGTDNFSVSAEVTTSNNTVTTNTSEINVTIVDSKDPVSGANVHYVTTNGKSINNGATETNAWDISKAFNSAKAGDIVYIKAGNYGNKNLVVNNSGTATAPIKFIGYTNVPGDLVSDKGSTFSYGNELNASKMPMIQGVRLKEIGQGIGVVIDKNNIHFSNFQIRFYSAGLRSVGDNNILENIIASDLGDFSSDHSYPTNTSNAWLNYNGVGISVSGNNVVLKNSVVINAGAEGIVVKGGSNQLHTYNKVFSDNNVNPCDYYYLLTQGSQNNRIENTFVYREKGLSHDGHGLICKEDASNNIFTSFEIINTGVELSFIEVHDNVFENGVIQGSYDMATGKKGPGGILIANGAHHNTLNNIKIFDVEAMISFADWVDGTKSPLDANDAGNNNIFIGVEGENAKTAIYFNGFAKLEGVAHDNQFQNCKFKNINRLFHVNRPNSNNKFLDCTFENIKTLQITSEGFNYVLNANTTFSNTTKINLGFSLP